MGFWLIFCFIVSTAYRSSLISHLVVQDLSDAIDNMKDLADRGKSEGWTWGVRRMTGSFKAYLSSSLDPSMLEVYQRMQVRGQLCKFIPLHTQYLHSERHPYNSIPNSFICSRHLMRNMSMSCCILLFG